MTLLAIDTVFDQCSIAITNHDGMIYEAIQTGKRQQTQQILPMIEKALAETGLSLAQFDGLAFNRGPGAFSGIRINTAVIQALSVATDIPCIGISSLQLLAQSAYDSFDLNISDIKETGKKETGKLDNEEHDSSSQVSFPHINSSQVNFTHVYSVLDARMKQVYLGEFKLDNGIMVPDNHSHENLLDYHKETKQNIPLITLTTDDKDLLSLLPEQNAITTNTPTATTLAKLAQIELDSNGGVSADQALPVYLRHNAWKTLAEQGK